MIDKTEEQLKELFGPVHESQRGYFAWSLFKAMARDKSIHLILGDLGYKVFDKHLEYFPDRVTNTGASEQAMMGIAVGLAMEGKKPFVYSITPFLLWRPAETIRLYINHEKIPVRLVASGRDDDYKHDGFSHNAEDISGLLFCFKNIKELWPENKEEIPDLVEEMVKENRPQFISLKR